ncbi:MAG TPA: hypothetical protein VGD64_09020 [Acidisarcina sp.]
MKSCSALGYSRLTVNLNPGAETDIRLSANSMWKQRPFSQEFQVQVVPPGVKWAVSQTSNLQRLTVTQSSPPCDRWYSLCSSRTEVVATDSALHHHCCAPGTRRNIGMTYALSSTMPPAWS